MTVQYPTSHVDNSLSLNAISGTLQRMHESARDDWKSMIGLTPLFFRSMMTGKSLMKTVPPSRFKSVYMPVSREEGEFLYMSARAINARKIVEFGSSFGVSTVYLAAAAKDIGDCSVVTTEIEPEKCRATEANLRQAGLQDYVQVIEGDALETLRDVSGPIDLLFLDGWKNLYLPILELLQPRLRKGALVFADNVRFPDARPYVERVRSPNSGFLSTSLFNGSLEYSCLVG